MKVATLLLLAMIVLSPTASLFPQPPQRDVPAEIDAARQALKTAYTDLQHAGGEWGGHRAAAMNHIDQAIKELGEAEKYAREHHDIK
jgi:hypothetical protein